MDLLSCSTVWSGVDWMEECTMADDQIIRVKESCNKIEMLAYNTHDDTDLAMRVSRIKKTHFKRVIATSCGFRGQIDKRLEVISIETTPVCQWATRVTSGNRFPEPVHPPTALREDI